MHTDPRRWSGIRRRVLSGGQSIRSVAAAEGVSRNTVRKMLRQERPARYSRAPRSTLLSGHTATVDALLLSDEALPPSERRSVAAIFRLLRDRDGYVGGYDIVRRYCQSVMVAERSVVVRTVGPIDAAGGLAISQAGRSYRLALDAPGRSTKVTLRVHRDKRAERAAEVSAWMDGVRAGRVGLSPVSDHAAVSRLLGSIHDGRTRTRNRALSALAHLHGFPATRIATALALSKGTVRRYLRAFREGGVEQLLAPDTRRPPGPERGDLAAAVFRLLHEPPADHGVNRTSWIMPDLRAVLSRQGFPACLHVLRQIIRDAGWKWRKARIVLTSTDPAYRDKLAAVQAILSRLGADEAFFSIDEFGPFAVKMKQGLALDPPGPHRVVPQWQRSRGCMIMTAALELSGNQVTHFYSERKNTTEMIRMMDVLVEQYADRRTLYLSWDAASWHVSKKLMKHVEDHNATASAAGRPLVETAPLPSGAQFLNVIESIFSGMARAVIHNSDYPSADAARAAIDRYFAERNEHLRANPKRAGKRIWGEERVPPSFSDSNNCKDPRWR